MTRRMQIKACVYIFNNGFQECPVMIRYNPFGDYKSAGDTDIATAQH